MEGAGSGSGSTGQEGDYDDEPVLKYQRMGADVGRLLGAAGGLNDVGEKETVVRMAVHDTCLVSLTFVRYFGRIIGASILA